MNRFEKSARYKGFRAQLIAALALGLLWFLTSIPIDSIPTIPSPSAVLSFALSNKSKLVHHLGATLLNSLFGLLFSVLITGLLVGLSYTNKTASSLITAALTVGKALPALAFGPFIIVMLGTGAVAKITICILICLPAAAIQSIEGANRVPRQLEKLKFNYGASPAIFLRRIALPYCIRGLLDGMRVAAPLALIGEIVAEFLTMGEFGIGVILQQLHTSGSRAGSLAIALICACVGLAIYSILRVIQMRYDASFHLTR